MKRKLDGYKWGESAVGTCIVRAGNFLKSDIRR